MASFKAFRSTGFSSDSITCLAAAILPSLLVKFYLDSVVLKHFGSLGKLPALLLFRPLALGLGLLALLVVDDLPGLLILLILLVGQCRLDANFLHQFTAIRQRC